MNLDSPTAERATTSATIMLIGAPGVGKTAFLEAVSPITPSNSVVRLGATADGLSGVAMEFIRVPLNDEVILHLFTAGSGQALWATWGHFARGAIGAVLLADSRRPDTVSASIDFLTGREVPYVVAVNRFDPAWRFEADGIRDALGVGPSVPIVACDARDRQSAKQTLITLVEHAGRA